MFHGGSIGGGGMGGRGRFDSDDRGKAYDSRVIGRLPKYLLPVKKWFGLGAVGMLFRTLAAMFTPYLVGRGTDYIVKGDLNGLNIMVLLTILTMGLMWLGLNWEHLNLSYAGQKIIYRMRTEMFGHLHQLPMSFFDRNQVGKLMSRVQNDVQQLQEIVTQGILGLLASLITLIGITIIMITMNWRLALIMLCIVPFMILLVWVWQRYARQAFTRVRRAIAKVNSQLQEDLSGVRVVQSLSREEENMGQFDQVNRAHLDANVNAVKLEALMMPAINILTGAAFAIVIIVGGFQVLDGVMTAGVLVSFLLYVQRFFDPILELSNQYAALQRAMASGARIFELMDVEPDITDKPGAGELPKVKGEISFKNVYFAYEPEKYVLNDINLAIKPGETVAIVGQTGSGKSSLVNLIARFYDVANGEVAVDGHNVRSVTQESLRRQIGIVPQDPILFAGTVEENIRYGRKDATRDEIVAVAQMVGAHSFISRLKEGYDTLVGQRGSNLSAGQRQLICMARALLTDPRILVFDEATSNVDTNTERVMQRALSKLTKGRTTITIAHRLSTITRVDRIIVLEKGKIIEQGSHKELLKQQGIYARMYQTLSAPGLAG